MAPAPAGTMSGLPALAISGKHEPLPSRRDVHPGPRICR